jgi:hypothetical protein
MRKACWNKGKSGEIKMGETCSCSSRAALQVLLGFMTHSWSLTCHPRPHLPRHAQAGGGVVLNTIVVPLFLVDQVITDYDNLLKVI